MNGLFLTRQDTVIHKNMCIVKQPAHAKMKNHVEAFQRISNFL